jgi:hypothetical protein
VTRPPRYRPESDTGLFVLHGRMVAARELIGAGWDGAARARIIDLVRREAPETVIALADIRRSQPHGRRTV